MTHNTENKEQDDMQADATMDNKVAEEHRTVREKLTLSNDPNKAMEEMMQTIDQLREALVEETKVLREANTVAFMDIQDKKLDVARDYMDGMQQLFARKDELKAADPTLKELLEQKRNEFAHVAHDNHAAIERMRSGMKRLGDRIMENAREKARRDRQIVYGAQGNMQSGLKASIGINESA